MKAESRQIPQKLAARLKFVCRRHRNELYTDLLSSGYLLSGTCCQKLTVEWHCLKLFKARFFCISASLNSAAIKFVTNGWWTGQPSPTTSGVAGGLSQGRKMSRRGDTGHHRGGTSQNSGKGLEKIVNLWMSLMSIQDKKRKHPKKRKKTTN